MVCFAVFMVVVGVVRLVGLLGCEAVLVAGLHRLGGLPWLRPPAWADAQAWLAVTPAEEVVVAAARLVALAGAWWLLGSTLAYCCARLAGCGGVVRVLGRVTVPAVRAVADRAVAVTVAGSWLLGGGAVAGAVAPPPPPPPPAVVAGSPADQAGAGWLPPGVAPPPVEAPAAASGAVALPDGVGALLRGEPLSVGEPSGDPTPAAPADPAAAGLSYTVAPGDSLWCITARRMDPGATVGEVAATWRHVVDANAPRLVSGDPDLIYPGEVVMLPPELGGGEGVEG